MRIRNNRKYDLYLPYAGQDKKGWNVKAGKLSPDVPAARFYDPILQSDWKRGVIDLVLSEADTAMLGEDITALEKTHVEVSGDAIVEGGGRNPISVVPGVPTAPLRTDLSPKESTARVSTAHIDLKPDSKSDPQADSKSDPKADPKITLEADPEVTLEADSKVTLEADSKSDPKADSKSDPKADSDRCVRCGGDLRVIKDKRINIPLCFRCRGALTRKLKATGGNLAEVTDFPLPQVPDNPPPPPHPINPEGAAGDTLSISDLQKQNERVRLGVPRFESSNPTAIPNLRAGVSQGATKVPDHISEFMGGQV